MLLVGMRGKMLCAEETCLHVSVLGKGKDLGSGGHSVCMGVGATSLPYEYYSSSLGEMRAMCFLRSMGCEPWRCLALFHRMVSQH